MKQAFVVSSAAHEISICDSRVLLMPCLLLRYWMDLCKLFAFVEFMALSWREVIAYFHVKSVTMLSWVLVRFAVICWQLLDTGLLLDYF